ncbi:hypothetical protein KKC08_01515 [Patescibacteria group bacterium]|nr:hypothetical protein [Patescibacteria group bacterium]MCG2702582.1 hypothetical protein [Candidatus Parcubacteria bacterium]MBU4264918.1 hypothetical protein [Patescibacteria group bacterium]MBU4390802.1 hypothetical protein [Patescibacteria group bacterium]MBU4396831.1 hypothetical protein [Patescibacteria group bacterium]
MKQSQSIKKIYQIDNSIKWLPMLTTVLFLIIIFLFIWFFRGGSFKLYASLFFSLYFLTHQIWLSVILIGVIQNLAFLPLRFIGLKLSTSLKAFEENLDQTKESDQYFLFTKKVKEGDTTVLFYIFNFIVNAIAFFSAGRIFLIDFYSSQISTKYLYDWVPYPKYPLNGTTFNFPFLNIDKTFSLPWKNIITVWVFILIGLIVPRLIWRFLKIFLHKNKEILKARISYNKILLYIGGFTGTLFVVSLFILRHIPTVAHAITLSVDLTKPSPAMNLITAIGTFITTLHAGWKRNKETVKKAQQAKIPQKVIETVSKDNLSNSFRNAVILGIGAYVVTSQIPSAFELSVLVFEVLYILSPYTFDLILKKQVNTQSARGGSTKPVIASE